MDESSGFPARHHRARRRTRRSAPQPISVEANSPASYTLVENCTIPELDLERLRPRLTKVRDSPIVEDSIFYGSRYHWVSLVEDIKPAIGLGLLALLAAFVSAGFKHSGTYTYPPNSTADSPLVKEFAWYWLPLICLVVVAFAAFAAWVRSWYWRYTYLVVTNLGLLWVRMLPPALFFLTSGNRRLDLWRIEEVRSSQNWAGKWLGYGTIGVEYPNDDVFFNNLDYVPNPALLQTVLDSTRFKIQTRMLRDMPTANQP